MKKIGKILLLILITGVLYPMENTKEITLNGKTYRFYEKDLLYGSGSYSDVFWRGILAEDTVLKLGKNEMVLAKKTELCFYYSGKPAYGYLAEETALKLGDQIFQFGKKTRIDFSENGALIKGYLAEDQEIKIGSALFLFKKGVQEYEDIEFYENGKIKLGFLAKNTSVKIGKNSYLLFKGIGFYPSGKIDYGHLAENTQAWVGKNQIILAGSEYHSVAFYEDGSLMGATLAEDQEIKAGNLFIPLTSQVSFSKEGNLTRGVLAKPFVFKNQTYPQFKTIVLQYDEDQNELIDIKIFKYPER